MIQPAKKHYTPEEYMALEEVADYKSEYYEGQIYAMSGGSVPHSTICVNLLTELGQKFKKQPCRVFNSDLRILVQQNGLYTYPDVAVVCGELQYAANKDGSLRNDTITNPVLLAEVLSPSTKNYDQGGKFAMYRTLPSLQHYLLLDSERIYLDHYQKTAQGWLLRTYQSRDDSLPLALGGSRFKLNLTALYNKVTFDEGE